MARKAVHTVLMIAVFGFPVDMAAQSFPPNYNFRHLNVQNGLSQNTVYHFLQDRRGYMWIGTHNGLNLFDGARTVNFLNEESNDKSISGNFISSIVEDSAGEVWVGTESAINRFHRDTYSFSRYGVDRQGTTKAYPYTVLLGFVTATELWFLDTDTRSVNLMNVTTGKTRSIAPLNANHAVLYRGNSNTVQVWSCYDKGTIHQVYRDGKLLTQRSYFKGDGPPDQPELEVSHVLQTSDSTAWLSTTEGLVRLNPVSGQFRVYDKWQGGPVRELRYAVSSTMGQLWIASGPSGVYRFDMTECKFIDNLRNSKLNPLSICGDNIVSLYFDRAGNAWCGSFGNGCSYTDANKPFFISHLAKSESQSWKGYNAVSWIGGDSTGRTWCLLSDLPGFWVLDKNGGFREHRQPLMEGGGPFSAACYKLLFETTDEAWCATNKGLFKYHIPSNRMRRVPYELMSDEVQGSIWIRDMIRLNDGSALFSTYAGLYRISRRPVGTKVNRVHFLNPGEFAGLGTMFQDPAGLVYIKALGHILYVLRQRDGDDFEILRRERFIPKVRQFFHEKGDSLIYLATSDGVYHIDPKSLAISREKVNDRLPFLNVCSFLKKNRLYWIFGQKGLYCYDQGNSRGRLYTVEDGLPDNEFIDGAMITTAEGRCLAGSVNGIVSFLADQQPAAGEAPRPQLNRIYVNDVGYDPSRNPDEIEKIALSSRQNTFSFDFSPVGFMHVSEWNFEYKLDGYDDEWIKAGAARYTRYSRIPPGEYVFNLRVLNTDGIPAPLVKTLAISVGRAFWQTTGFRVGLVSLLIFAAWMLAKWLFNQKIKKQKREYEKLQAIEKERTRIATDMHDDLGSGLSRIKFLSQALSNKSVEDGPIKAGLERITSYSDEMTEKMGEIVWALNERNDTLADLVAYTRTYAMEYLGNHGIDCEADTPLHLPGDFIPGEVRRNVFLAVKESLHNVVKHSGATKVRMEVRLDKDIRITIHDNGKGIDWSRLRPYSNGLHNIGRRMEEVKGTAAFSSEGGTKVLLTVPLGL